MWGPRPKITKKKGEDRAWSPRLIFSFSLSLSSSFSSFRHSLLELFYDPSLFSLSLFLGFSFFLSPSRSFFYSLFLSLSLFLSFSLTPWISHHRQLPLTIFSARHTYPCSSSANNEATSTVPRSDEITRERIGHANLTIRTQVFGSIDHYHLLMSSLACERSLGRALQDLGGC